MITKSEVANANGKDGKPVWIIYDNSVYDVTNYLTKHPGGTKILKEYAGRDCTKDFNDMGHTIEALSQMKRLKIGDLLVEKSTLSQNSSFASIADSEKKRKRRFLLCR